RCLLASSPLVLFLLSFFFLTTPPPPRPTLFPYTTLFRSPDLMAEEFHLPMGTGPYISPEQVRHIRSDSRSDIFSLGVVLYYLATGERPFGNPTGVHGLRRRLYRDPVPPRAIAPACPPWLQEIILHCLEVDPRARY